MKVVIEVIFILLISLNKKYNILYIDIYFLYCLTDKFIKNFNIIIRWKYFVLKVLIF